MNPPRTGKIERHAHDFCHSFFRVKGSSGGAECPGPSTLRPSFPNRSALRAFRTVGWRGSVFLFYRCFSRVVSDFLVEKSLDNILSGSIPYWNIFEISVILKKT